MLVFVKVGKPENPEKKPSEQGENQQQTRPHMAPGRNGTRGTLVEASDLTTAPSQKFNALDSVYLKMVRFQRPGDAVFYG